MKFISFFYIITSILSLAAAQSRAPKCSKIYVRKNVNFLTTSEWSMIKKVLYQLQSDGHFTRISRTHQSLNFQIHGTAMFLPFHRRLLADFEQAGRKYDPDFFIPYWNAANDFRAPEKNVLFNFNNLGGNGNPAQGNCVKDGVQLGWTMQYPDAHCLKRQFMGQEDQLPVWYSPEFITSITQTSNSYDVFRNNIENSLHMAVHVGIGGDMNTLFSPNDFIFFLHHANIDRIYWKWQNSKPGNLMKYDGANRSSNFMASLNDIIPSYQDQVGDTMILGYGNICYTYDDSSPLSRLIQDDSISGQNETESTISKSEINRDGTFVNFRNSMAYKRYRMLSNETLSRFFPAILDGDFNANLFEMKDVKSQLRSEVIQPQMSSEINSKLPVPDIPISGWIEMHKLNEMDVRSVVDNLGDLAKALNEEGYISPN